MLSTNVFVEKGVIFIKFDGVINNYTIKELDNTINYLLYNIGAKYFVIDFLSTALDKKIIPNLNNKLIEIYSSCEKLVLKGLNENKLFDLSFLEVGCY